MFDENKFVKESLKEYNSLNTDLAYTYKLFEKSGKNLVFRQDLTRQEFNDFRKERNIDFNVPGCVNFRNAEGTKYAVLEYVERNKFNNDKYNILVKTRNELLNQFIIANNIVKVNAFEIFVQEYVEMDCELTPWFIENYYSNLEEIEEVVLEVFKNN